MTSWTHASLGFGIALAITLVATPIARSMALRLRMFDHPREGKVHRVPIPYLGGIAILVGFLLSIFVTGAWHELGGVTAATVVLAVMGLVDDAKGIGALPRFLVHVLAAGIALSTGILATPTNVEGLNVALTLLWLVGITNAFNLLDNMNGLSAGLATIASIFFFLMAFTEGQQLVAVLAAAVAGASSGFLPYNFPKARIFMGDAGSVPLGFLLAVISLKVRFPIAQPWSFAAPICVLLVAVVDTSIVMLDRIRSGRSIAIGGTDHLSHRLVRIGLTPPTAVSFLLSVSGVVGTVGVLGGWGIVAPAVMALTGVACCAGGAFLLQVVGADAGQPSETPPIVLDKTPQGIALREVRLTEEHPSAHREQPQNPLTRLPDR
jgi:UDP-GlcNAc:undecaprenyl-phosphate GlcNAc-1-phosphate transferase